MYTQYITGRILVAINHTYSTVCLIVLAIGQGLGIRLPLVLEQDWELDYSTNFSFPASHENLVLGLHLRTWE